jgi:hypothetical protein
MQAIYYFIQVCLACGIAGLIGILPFYLLLALVRAKNNESE